MTILCFLYCLLGFCSFTHQYGSNKVLVTCECLMTASIISPDTTTCCLGQGPPAKLLSKMKMMVVIMVVLRQGPPAKLLLKMKMMVVIMLRQGSPAKLLKCSRR